MRKNTVIRTFNIHKDAMGKLEQYAEQNDLSVSEVVRRAIDLFLSPSPSCSCATPPNNASTPPNTCHCSPQ